MRDHDSRLQAITERRHPEKTSPASLAYEASTLEAAAAIMARRSRAQGCLRRVIFRFTIMVIRHMADDLHERAFMIFN